MQRPSDEELRELLALHNCECKACSRIRAIVEELLERRAAQSAYPSADVLVRLPQEDVNND